MANQPVIEYLPGIYPITEYPILLFIKQFSHENKTGM